MRISNIIANDVVNGEDVCVSLFVQGCPLHCPGCFNPETWDFNGGTEIEWTDLVMKLIDLVHKNGIQRNFSCLGGEPLAPQNRADVAGIIDALKGVYPTIKIWVWTGYTIEELQAMNDPDIDFILNTIDVLIDGPYIESERDLSLPHSGSRNQRVIHLKGGEIVNNE